MVSYNLFAYPSSKNGIFNRKYKNKNWKLAENRCFLCENAGVTRNAAAARQ
jgi:hypothetical protein